MPTTSLPRAVIDTNVIFEGLSQQGSAAGLIVEAWLAGLFQACISTALAYEYVEVLSREWSEANWQRRSPALGVLLDRAEFVSIHYSWRPASPDPDDDLVVDCAMNAGAILVTANVRDFSLAQRSLGLVVMTPVEFVKLLANLRG